MHNNIKSNHQSELQVKEKSGPITIAELLSCAKHTAESCENKSNLKGLILDLRQAWLSSDLKDVVKTRNICQNFPHLFKAYNIAVVATDPRLVASTILLRPKVEPPFSIKPFSTLEEAEKWIHYFG